MASRVLLISANTSADPYPVFPLGLAHVDGALRRAGHETEWFDCKFEGGSVSDRITSFRPDAIGISLRNIDDVIIKKRETFYGRLFSLCNEIRRISRCPIILGGSGYSIFPERLLTLSGADFGIHGEGENSLVALLEALQHGASHAAIPGLVFRKDGAVVINPKQGTDLTRDVAPAHRPRRIVDYYLQNSQMLNVQTQRGCPQECCYCTYPVIEGRCYRRRPAEAVIEELLELQGYGATYFLMVDSLFNSSAEHVTALCEGMIRRGVEMRWGCFIRPSGLTAELMRLMARAGLAHIEFGSDSFCDEVLQAYGKRFFFDDILRANRLAAQEDIDCCHFLICGGPGETEETLRRSFTNSQLLGRGIVLALVGMRVYPGTALFERMRKEGRLPENADLLRPYYYLSPGLQEAGIFQRLERFARQSPRWIVGDPPPSYVELTRRLRDRGVVGPLWSYLALMQNLTPTAAPD
jgi:radical SAM superfamily enzyme YgiQ (UPF0313 family)